ncbi:winged helix-turn-helix domain-containing protein [Photorhabdus noenieputensis]|uniref:winged helix-turn-helix domain-containing protein n=1 Tax=Photorhabdus noenieputensis TaxID=1208607 RepID=UPI001FD5890F|nr:winged helix-turn-helix domain-containing protein [Photorhabdus noenieputensis]MCK3670239.1 winged helix-turn-helix domain-containing protein [Photorhabdus noenieputensis]
MLKITRDVYLDCDSNKIIHGKNIFIITEKEKRLLLALWEHASQGNTLNREQLIPLVWPERKNGVAETNLLQLICKLRRTLRYCDLDEAIHTVYRQGYRFILPFQDNEQDNNQPQNTRLPIPIATSPKPFYWRFTRMIVMFITAIIWISTILYTAPFLAKK